MKSLEFWFKKYVRQLPYCMVTLSPGDYEMICQSIAHPFLKAIVKSRKVISQFKFLNLVRGDQA